MYIKSILSHKKQYPEEDNPVNLHSGGRSIPVPPSLKKIYYGPPIITGGRGTCM